MLHKCQLLHSLTWLKKKKIVSMHSFNNHLLVEDTCDNSDIGTLLVWMIHPRIRFLSQKSLKRQQSALLLIIIVQNVHDAQYSLYLLCRIIKHNFSYSYGLIFLAINMVGISFSVNDWKINNLDFVGHMIYIETTQLL